LKTNGINPYEKPNPSHNTIECNAVADAVNPACTGVFLTNTDLTKPAFPEILSPEKFFMRSGIRHPLDKGGAAYIPSGFISIDGMGNVHLGKPLN
jgi:hypothetical protein